MPGLPFSEKDHAGLEGSRWPSFPREAREKDAWEWARGLDREQKQGPRTLAPPATGEQRTQMALSLSSCTSLDFDHTSSELRRRSNAKGGTDLNSILLPPAPLRITVWRSRAEQNVMGDCRSHLSTKPKRISVTLSGGQKKQCRKRHLGQWGVGEALENSFPRSTKIVASKTKVFWPVLKSSPAPLQPASQRLPTAKDRRSGSPSHPQEMDEVAHTQDEHGAAIDLANSCAERVLQPRASMWATRVARASTPRKPYLPSIARTSRRSPVGR